MRTKERWQEIMLPKILKSFSPRIQKDFQTIELALDSLTNVEDGGFIYGNVGSGKTILAIQYLLKYTLDRYTTAQDFPFLFVTIPDLLQEIKASFNCQGVEGSEASIIKKYSDVDFLVLDDFGVEKNSEWSYQILYLIINHRYENLKITFFTSNYTLSDIRKQLGDDRIPSRIDSMCMAIHLSGMSKRKKIL